MTVEVGAITGELELATRRAEESLHVSVRYAGAEEWYTVEGSPIALENLEPLTSAPHETIVEHLEQPGPVVSGNESPVSLKSFGSSSGG